MTKKTILSPASQDFWINFLKNMGPDSAQIKTWLIPLPPEKKVSPPPLKKSMNKETLRRRFVEAVKGGNLPEMTQCLVDGAKVETRFSISEESWVGTALAYFVKKQSINGIKALLPFGPSVSDFYELMSSAISNMDYEIIDLLVLLGVPDSDVECDKSGRLLDSDTYLMEMVDELLWGKPAISPFLIKWLDRHQLQTEKDTRRLIQDNDDQITFLAGWLGVAARECDLTLYRRLSSMIPASWPAKTKKNLFDEVWEQALESATDPLASIIFMIQQGVAPAPVKNRHPDGISFFWESMQLVAHNNYGDGPKEPIIVIKAFNWFLQNNQILEQVRTDIKNGVPDVFAFCYFQSNTVLISAINQLQSLENVRNEAGNTLAHAWAESDGLTQDHLRFLIKEGLDCWLIVKNKKKETPWDVGMRQNQPKFLKLKADYEKMVLKAEVKSMAKTRGRFKKMVRNRL